ncbi:MAG: hypothetical protein AAFR54_12585, partial [Planctomycetota bacterium]
MHPRKKYRMSGIVVAIGYILLIPSFFGVLLGGASIAAGAGGVAQASETRQAAAEAPRAQVQPALLDSLRAMGVPQTHVETLRRGERVPEAAIAQFDPIVQSSLH